MSKNKEHEIRYKGNYVNPKNGREYYIVPKESSRCREPNHVIIGRAENYKGPLQPKRFVYKDD